MPSLKEQVDAEEARVKAELAAESDEPEPDEPTEPEPDEPEAVAAGPTDADLKRFESENTRHERALEKIVGDDWKDFAPCDTCGGVGHLPAALNSSVPFERDPQTEPCEVCKGYGTTLTGAKDPGMVTRACSRCQGSGWTSVVEQPHVQPTVTLEAPNGGAEPAQTVAAVPVDPTVQALRDQGYIILDPPVVVPPAGS